MGQFDGQAARKAGSFAPADAPADRVAKATVAL
jgi:hypothetical protein